MAKHKTDFTSAREGFGKRSEIRSSTASPSNWSEIARAYGPGTAFLLVTSGGCFHALANGANPWACTLFAGFVFLAYCIWRWVSWRFGIVD